jgi:hypothetical protein
MLGNYGGTDEVSASPSVAAGQRNWGRAEVRRKLNSQPADVEAMQYPGEHADAMRAPRNDHAGATHHGGERMMEVTSYSLCSLGWTRPCTCPVASVPRRTTSVPQRPTRPLFSQCRRVLGARDEPWLVSSSRRRDFGRLGGRPGCQALQSRPGHRVGRPLTYIDEFVG